MKAIKVGNFTLDTPVFLAPMTGVSDLPFRTTVHSLGGTLAMGEMIASKSTLHENLSSRQKSMFDENVECRIVQLAGCEPDVMSEAAKLNIDRGANWIDINFGCPVKKVVNSYAGSALMKDPDLAVRIVEAVIKSVKVPVTVKMRTGWCSNTRNAPDLAKRLEDVGAQMITVHGRTRNQLYNGTADWEFIRNVKDKIQIPLIVNGDIKSFENATTALEQSGADGIMIARGSYGKPWIIGDMVRFFKSGDAVKTSFDSKADLYNSVVEPHISSLLEFYGKQGMLFARKHLGWYSQGYPNSAEFRSSVNTCKEDDISQFLQRVKAYFLDY